MLKKRVTFTDFNGNLKTEDLYFHVSKASVLTAPDKVYDEIIEIAQKLQETGKRLEDIEALETDINMDDPFDKRNIELADGVRMVGRLLDRLVDLSYGKKSDDGMRFVKNETVVTQFKESAVYDAFVEQMIDNTESMIQFINQLLAPTMATK